MRTRTTRIGASVLLVMTLAACHHAHLAAIRVDPSGREDLVEGDSHFKEKDVSWLWWGQSQPDDVHVDCNRNGVAHVETKMNFGVSILTFGIWTPGTVRWKCATDPQVGLTFGPRTLPPPPPSPSAQPPDGGAP